jgi:DNA (cytosine-5)-methyltransferase 1
MGYNVRFCKVQCGFYGVPQHRWRVKIIFAKKGFTLPLAPCPTTQMAGFGDAGGPGAAVTINDAISDLQRWDFRNPHIVYGKESTLKDARPYHLRPPQYESDGTKTVGPFQSKYTSPPQNEFQHTVRPIQSEFVYQHQTLPVHLPAIERVWNIPFTPGSNHLSLLNGHARLALNPSIELECENANKKAYGRLDANGIFDIVTSNYTLETKHGR